MKVNLKVAKKLKQLGFDWNVRTGYNTNNDEYFETWKDDNFNQNPNTVSIPDLNLVNDWFRIKHRLNITVHFSLYTLKWNYVVLNISDIDKELKDINFEEEPDIYQSGSEIPTYDEAHLLAIDYAIDKANNMYYDFYNLACEKISQAKQQCISNYCKNESGVLWESIWKYEDGKIKQKTCCSGLFNDWKSFDDETKAIVKMIEELKIIYGIKDN